MEMRDPRENDHEDFFSGASNPDCLVGMPYLAYTDCILYAQNRLSGYHPEKVRSAFQRGYASFYRSLLYGISSVLCVYRGNPRQNTVPSKTRRFHSTAFGLRYRWFRLCISLFEIETFSRSTSFYQDESFYGVGGCMLSISYSMDSVRFF